MPRRRRKCPAAHPPFDEEIVPIGIAKTPFPHDRRDISIRAKAGCVMTCTHLRSRWPHRKVPTHYPSPYVPQL